ncbi:MAG TPA: hypothetical protein VE978_11150 [Chitinophagales bacterium]|nr:hypothetical protein [Chitinophagales bacterium]
MILLSRDANDNPQFISNIEKIIWDRIQKWEPKDLYLTRIDNWFDDKWMKFSGTTMHEISIWYADVTVPPFHPNRVESCEFYQYNNGGYVLQVLNKKLHIEQWSQDNFKRRISGFTRNGIFFWYSGNSNSNDKGALMCYFVKDNECFTFYILLSGNKGWNVNKTNGISAKEIQDILSATKTDSEIKAIHD